MWETMKITLPSCWSQRMQNLLVDKHGVPDSHSPAEVDKLWVTGAFPSIVMIVLCAHSAVSILSFSEKGGDKWNLSTLGHILFCSSGKFSMTVLFQSLLWSSMTLSSLLSKGTHMPSPPRPPPRPPRNMLMLLLGNRSYCLGVFQGWVF